MADYYNEIDPYAAATLRNLIAAGHIGAGDVDERSIEDVSPDDLRGYTQCHFFAGVGVWSLALRLAGWPDDRPVWTGSCPCQPFSAAGKGAGFADERHLWPAWYHLVSQRRPPSIFGEQVASKNADPWIDLVHDDLEALGYAFGAVPFPSAGVGAPHIRDRLYWVADTAGKGLEGRQRSRERLEPQLTAFERDGKAGGMANLRDGRRSGHQGCAPLGHGTATQSDRGFSGLANNAGCGRREERAHVGGGALRDRAQGLAAGLVNGGGNLRPGPVNGLWADADWLLCRDGKWRPVEPGTFPLAHGSAGGMGRVRADQERLAARVPRKDQGSRTGRLRAYGNAINAKAAQVFIEAFMKDTTR